MMRSIFCVVCIIFLTVSSCNNDEATPGTENPEQEKQLRALIAQYQDSTLLKENLIQYFRENDNYGKALEETSNFLEKDSLNDRLLDIKATLHFENGDTLNAIKAFEKAITINPRPEYEISLGSLYAQTKNPMALAMADSLLQAPGSNTQPQGLFIKGLFHSYTGNKVKALIFLTIA